MLSSLKLVRRRGRPKLGLQEFAKRHLDFIGALEISSTLTEAGEKCGFSHQRASAIAKRLGYRFTLNRERYAP